MKKTFIMLLSVTLFLTLFLSFTIQVDAKEDTGKRLVKTSYSDDSVNYVYDENGNCILEYTSVDPFRMAYTSKTYNKSGQVSTELVEFYNKLTQIWRPQKKEVYGYNADGLLESVECWTYNYETEKLEIQDESREHYTYDASGNLLERKKGTTSTWTYEYDAAGHLIKKTTVGVTTIIEEYHYVGDQLMWYKRGTNRERYEYGDGIVTLYYETNNTPENDDTWQCAKKIITETDGTTEISTTYVYNINQWAIQSKTKMEYTYNEEGVLLSSIQSRYLSDQWVLFEKKEDTYDNVGDLLEEAWYSYSEGSWTKKSSTEYHYMDVLEILDGKNQVVFPDGSQSITFRSEAPLSELQSVLVDGKLCASTNYDTSSGSTIVTLHADYIATLSEGQHVLSIISTSGIATVSFLASPYYTVTYNNNGHGVCPDPEVVIIHEKAAEPEKLTEDGYNFVGWFKENTFTNKWDFNSDTITEDVTLYGQWVKIASEISADGADADTSDAQEALQQILEKYEGAADSIKVILDIVKDDVDETEKGLILEQAAGKELVCYDVSLTFVEQNDASDYGDSNTELIKITYDFDFTGKEAVQVFRVHNGEVSELTTTPNAEDEYVEFDKTNGKIIIDAKKYSTYAFAYNESEQTPPATGDASKLLLFSFLPFLALVALFVLKAKKDF